MIQRIVALAFFVAAIAPVSPAYSRSRAFDLQHSKMTVHVYKQGMFSFLADNHEVDAPILSGSYDSADKAIELTVDATKMRVMDPSLPAQKRESVQTNMAGLQVLDVADYPTITFRSTTIDDVDANHWTVTGDLTLRGQVHPITVKVQAKDATNFTGTATVRQTAFGITPIRIAGGAVTVKDDVTVEFEIALQP
jgi:polyisoprenoid-binding protein YceI